MEKCWKGLLIQSNQISWVINQNDEIQIIENNHLLL